MIHGIADDLRGQGITGCEKHGKHEAQHKQIEAAFQKSKDHLKFSRLFLSIHITLPPFLFLF